MLVHKCDSCGKEIVLWMNIKTVVGSYDKLINIADLLNYQGEVELCKECFYKLVGKIEENKNGHT